MKYTHIVLASALGLLAATSAYAAASGGGIAPALNLLSANTSATAGKVTGRVSFEGEKPEIKPLDIPEEKSKGCTKEGKAMETVNESLLLGKDGGLANVVVSVEVPDAKVVVPDKPVDLDQMACHYVPHMVIVPVGTTVEYRNSDAVSHNVHSYPQKNDPINKTIVAGSKETQLLDKADKIEFKCDIHPWMNAWLIVSDSPYVAVTDADGNFAIEGLKAGEYKVKYWHEKLGKGEGKLVVKEDGSADKIDFKMGAEKKGPPKRK